MRVKNYIDFEVLEREYFDNHNTWKIEEEILFSFKPKELKIVIKELNKDYLLFKLPYIQKIWELKKKVNSNLEKYFVEQVEFYFNWWEELGLHKKNLIERFERFYQIQYINTRKNAKYSNFDINSVPIIEVLSHYMRVPQNLRRNIKCPLHKEKTWSFKIYKNSNSWFCFGCHKWGNAINFVAEIENISSKEAFIKLANLYSNLNNNGQ